MTKTNDKLRKIAQSGVLVTLNLCGGESKMADTISTQLEGQSDEILKYYSDFKTPSYLTILGKENSKTFKNTKCRVRNRLTDMSVALNNTFLLLPDFVRFKDYFEEQKEIFNEEVERIIADYPNIKATFLNDTHSYLLKNMPSSLTTDEQEAYKKHIEHMIQGYERNYPTEEEIKNQFKFDMNVSLISFTMPENLDSFNVLDAEQQEDILKLLEDGMDDSYDRIYRETKDSAFLTLWDVVQRNLIMVQTAVMKGEDKVTKRAYTALTTASSRIANIQSTLQDDDVEDVVNWSNELVESYQSDLANFSSKNEIILGEIYKASQEGIISVDLPIIPKATDIVESIVLMYGYEDESEEENLLSEEQVDEEDDTAIPLF